MAVNVFATGNQLADNVSRQDLVEWVNTSLHLNFTKVENFCSGEYLRSLCIDNSQVPHTANSSMSFSPVGLRSIRLSYEILFAGLVPLKKVKFDAKLEWEFLENFKLLQTMFQKKSIEKVNRRVYLGD
jgi:RP/EB family microtubule-associated protein